MTELKCSIFIDGDEFFLEHGVFGWYYMTYVPNRIDKINYIMGVVCRFASVKDILIKNGIGINDIRAEFVIFPEFRHKEDLLKFVNVIALNYLVSDTKPKRDDLERHRLGIKK